MQAKKIAEIIEQMAPLELAYKGDKLGFIVGDSHREVSSVGVTWRPTVDVLQLAGDAGVDMLIIHEPLFQRKKAFLVDPAKLEWSPNEKRQYLVESGGFVVYRAHSNLDDAEPGQNTELAARLGLSVIGKLPYGRLGTVEHTDLASFVERVKERLECPHVLVVGTPEISIHTVAIIAGGGNALVDVLELAKLEGADVMVSGDIQDSRARFATELGLAVIDAGGYYTETPGMRAFAQRLEKRLPGIPVSYFDPGPPWSVR